MTTEFRLPDLGENIASGDVVKVLVSVGDTLTKEQPVLELETDKATLDIPTSVEGTIKEIRVKQGDTIHVGQVVLVVENGASAKEDRERARREAKPVEVSLGQEPVAEPVEKKPPADSSRPIVGPPPPPPIEKIAPAAPSVRRLAHELGVDIQLVPGSGAGGRISIEDVKQYARQVISEGVSGAPVAPLPTAPLPDFARWGPIERQPMTNIRRKTAENMSLAWTTVPHVTQFDKADITGLEQLRQTYSNKVEAAGGKLTVTAIIMKVIASALKVFPKFNASLDLGSNEIILKKYYHLGVAVDTEHGLLVPVIRDVDKKNILDLSVELSRMAERARNKKLSLDEMQGGTFTITNLGGIGGTHFSPIVYAPQVAILGIARAGMGPVYVNGQFEPRLMLPLGLSYDHRLIDGAEAARFLRWVVEALQQPFLLMLEG
jgi:pyruvate dehydrogenase E2 component (dihydrolipoamide acetyltransferase)